MTTRIQTSIRWRLFNPKPPEVIYSHKELTRLGSRYGGKFAELSSLNENSIIISGGAGEDISFELEIASKVNPTIYVVDPTPQAIVHYKLVKQLGRNPRRVIYSNSSRQDPNSYDTSRVDFTKIHFLELALWEKSTELKLYEPLDGSRDSSHSISGIDNNYRRKTNHILVKTTSIPELLRVYKLERIDLLKLDIEGAALEVLLSTFVSGIFPSQIILEIDEMHFPGLKSWARARSLRKLMDRNGYNCVKRDNCDFTFIKYTRESNYVD